MIPLERLCSSWNNKGDGLNVAVVDRLEPSHDLVLMDLIESVYALSGFSSLFSLVLRTYRDTALRQESNPTLWVSALVLRQENELVI